MNVDGQLWLIPDDTETDPHPCPYSWPVLHVIGDIIRRHQPGHVHDPFGGDGQRLGGLVDALAQATRPQHLKFTGTDLVRWVNSHPAIVHGDATAPDSYPTGNDWWVVTSPTYNNGFGDTFVDDSERHTYTTAARRELDPTNTGRYTGRNSRDGEEQYWRLHHNAVKHWPGTCVVNVKDSVRDGSVYPLCQLWVELMGARGYSVTEAHRVDVDGNRNGANNTLRVDHEMVYLFQQQGAKTDGLVSEGCQAA